MDFYIVPFFRVILSLLLACKSGLSTFEPEFVEPVANVTVAIGRQATLSCAVSHLGSYKVAWVKVDTQTILAIHHHVITRNYRINLSHSDEKYWYLHIKDVQEADRGYYMCQINTTPMKSQKGYLEIVYPPNIIDAETSNDVVTKEGDNVSLTCRADGHPRPYIIWRREDGKGILFGNWEVETVDGEVLNISRVSRLHMAAYLCIASNGVPPSVSKRIVLQVHFSPHTWIPNQLVGGYVGGEVELECNTEAFPKSINYWTTAEGDMITSGDKYEAVLIDDVYLVLMKLKIRNLEPKDFGMYRCIARNFLGETDGSVNLYEIPIPTMSSTTTTEKANFETKDHRNEKHNPKHDIGDTLREPPFETDNTSAEPSIVRNSEDAALYRPTKPRPKTSSDSDSGFVIRHTDLILFTTLSIVLLSTALL